MRTRRWPLEPGPFALSAPADKAARRVELGNPKSLAGFAAGAFTLYCLPSDPEAPAPVRACRLEPLNFEVEAIEYDLLCTFRRGKVGKADVLEAAFVPRGAFFERLCALVVSYENLSPEPARVELQLEGPEPGFPKHEFSIFSIPLPEYYSTFEGERLVFDLPPGERAFLVLAALKPEQREFLPSLQHWRTLQEALQAQVDHPLGLAEPDLPAEAIETAFTWAKACLMRHLHEGATGWYLFAPPPAGAFSPLALEGVDYLLPAFNAHALRTVTEALLSSEAPTLEWYCALGNTLHSLWHHLVSSGGTSPLDSALEARLKAAIERLLHRQSPEGWLLPPEPAASAGDFEVKFELAAHLLPGLQVAPDLVALPALQEAAGRLQAALLASWNELEQRLEAPGESLMESAVHLIAYAESLGQRLFAGNRLQRLQSRLSDAGFLSEVLALKAAKAFSGLDFEKALEYLQRPTRELLEGSDEVAPGSFPWAALYLQVVIEGLLGCEPGGKRKPDLPLEWQVAEVKHLPRP